MKNNSLNKTKFNKCSKTTKKKKNFFFTSSCTVHLLHWAEHDLVLLEIFFSAKILCIFQWKHLGFHPQTSIFQSKPKKVHKKRIKGRTKISPNFRNPIKWAPKNGFQTKKWETQNNPNMQLKCHPCMSSNTNWWNFKQHNITCRH